jgi:hypothetical protein
MEIDVLQVTIAVAIIISASDLNFTTGNVELPSN